jgi:hypothetical protein
MTTTTKQHVAADLKDLIATLRPEGRSIPESREGESDAHLRPVHLPSEVSSHPSRAESEAPTSSATAPARRSAAKRDAGKRNIGKRSDPGYQLVGAYVRKQTLLAVKQKLLTREQDVSELIEELLTAWLHRRA